MKPENTTRSYDFLWLGLALLPLLIIALLLPLTPHDYWWYLRLGQDILKAGAIPQVDTFSFTQIGKPVVYHSWLAAVLLWLTYQSGGLSLTFLLRAVVIGLTYVLIYYFNRAAGNGVKATALLVIAAGLAGSSNWSIRPQIFIYPLFVLTVWTLWRWQKNAQKNLWWLPVLAVLWVNLHGSFPLLFVLGAAALAFGRGDRRQLAVWLGISLLGTLLNPRVLGVWGYVSNMLSSQSNQQFSNEWAFPVNAGWQMNIFFGWLLLFGVLAAFSSQRLTWLEWVWFLGFGWMALSGLRYVIWFLLLIGPLTAVLVSHWKGLDRLPVKVFPAFNILLGSAFILLPLIFLPGLREGWWTAAPSPYDEVTTPVAATDWLEAHPELQGPLWSDFGFSSYLDFALPSRAVWIDTRFEVYPTEQWRQYLVMANAEPGWEALLAGDGINMLMLSTAAEPRLIEAVSDSQEWCEPYRDVHAVIFTRRSVNQNCP